MNKKIIVSAFLVAAMFTASANAVLSYYEPGPATAPVCNNEKPQKAWLYKVKALGRGQYQLYWDKADRATTWTIGFGTQPGKYIYGLNDFGNDLSRNLIVNTYSNRKFYFVIKANNGCMPGDWSNEWKVGTVVAGTVIPTPVTTIAPIKKLVTVAPTPTTVRGTTPVVSKAPAVKTPVVVPTPTPVPQSGLWGWLKGLFK
jgi:hypothetical protein